MSMGMRDSATTMKAATVARAPGEGAEHVFSLSGSWSGGTAGHGQIQAGALEADVSVPGQLGGPGQGTNPEELLLGAASSCYLITLAAICTRRALPIVSITLESDARFTAPPALKLLGIVHRPVITFDGPDDEASREAIRDAAHRAELFCMVSGALRGNAAVTVEPTVVHV